jgi:hypothetical protein
VDDWTLKGLQHGAVPKGTTPDSVFSNQVGVGGRAALTGFATQGYCSPVHTDTRDPRFTLGIRFDKPSSERKVPTTSSQISKKRRRITLESS